MSWSTVFCFGLVVTLITIVLVKNGTFRFVYLTSKIPGPPIWEYVANHAWKLLTCEHMLPYLCKLTEDYHFKPWGFWTMTRDFLIVVSDPDTIGEIYKNQYLGDKPELLYSSMRKYLGKGSMVQNGEPWRRHRKVSSAIFKKSVLDSNMHYVVERAEKFVESLREKAGGVSFDIGRIVDINILQMTSTFISSGAAPLPERFLECIKNGAALAQMKAFNPVYHWFLTKFDSNTVKTEEETQKCMAEAKAIAKREFERRSESENKLVDAVSICLKWSEKIGEMLFGEDDRLDESLTVISVGTDTTATTTTTAIALLALHQHVQERVVQEINDIFECKNQRPTPKDLDRMEYLGMVIKETMRLFPAGPVFLKKAQEETTVNGTTIPKGSCIALNIMALHRNPDNFEDPLSFKPERFSAENSESRHPYSFLPFSSGLRNCVGQAQAMIVLKIALSTLLRHYKILPGDGLCSMEDIKYKMCVTMNVFGANVRLVPRDELQM